MEEQKRAVTSGHFPIYRYDPRLASQGKNPFLMDSKEPSTSLDDYRFGENRYLMLKKSDPERAAMLSKLAEKDMRRTQKMYRSLAEISYGDENKE